MNTSRMILVYLVKSSIFDEVGRVEIDCMSDGTHVSLFHPYGHSSHYWVMED